MLLKKNIFPLIFTVAVASTSLFGDTAPQNPSPKAEGILPSPAKKTEAPTPAASPAKNEISPVTKQTLLGKAAEARKLAYAPYSQFLVGAAVLATSGKIYSACNVENSSYSLTTNAETLVITKAISEGDRSFKAMAVSMKGRGIICGASLQVISEFAVPNFIIFLCDENGREIETISLSSLLPRNFSARNLE